jgi:DNA-binding CsgD family transcriptional regulator
MTAPGARTGARLAELLAALSLATDLGMGQSMEHMLRQCLIALRLAERLGLSVADRTVVYYASLLAWVGCHVDAYEQAKWLGDDTVLKTDFRQADFATVAARPLFMMRHLGAGRPAAERARLALAFLRDGRHAAESMLANHWLAADGLAARLGLTQRVRDCVAQTFERWDGRGVPCGMRGEEILLTSRLVCLADVTEVYHRAAGTAAAVSVARERSGTQFDPSVVDLFAAHAAPVLDGLDDGGTEPRPHRDAASPAEAAAAVRAKVRAGRLDGDAATAVLAAAGHRATRRTARTAGLTSREVEVLRLLATGLSNREIAERLVISPRTAGHHVEHIYAKTGTANRAMASLFAANHGLISGLPEAELRSCSRVRPPFVSS